MPSTTVANDIAPTDCERAWDLLPKARRAWPKDFTVRQCEPADGGLLNALFEQISYRQFASLRPSFGSPDEVAAWIEANRAGAYQIVGTAPRMIVAFAGLYPLQGFQNHIGWISLGVREEAQGRGYGASLLRVILASADRVAGLRRLQLHVLSDNARAISLNRAFGFEIEGRHAQFARREDRYVDAFTMARLSSAA